MAKAFKKEELSLSCRVDGTLSQWIYGIIHSVFQISYPGEEVLNKMSSKQFSVIWYTKTRNNFDLYPKAGMINAFMQQKMIYRQSSNGRR